MRFDWNPEKAKLNEANHEGITFEQAILAFYDKWSIEEFDDEHSDISEDRFTIVGLADNDLLRVTFTIREDEEGKEIIRIISARKAKGKEKQDYEEARNELDQ
ncbi:MAG: BrnT family toxin [Pyrinomonadaceae bacterium]|jgi:hypothetical protein|nr:BrnT family toxin [Pyrinomonadaceae bacterium]